MILGHDFDFSLLKTVRKSVARSSAEDGSAKPGINLTRMTQVSGIASATKDAVRVAKKFVEEKLTERQPGTSVAGASIAAGSKEDAASRS